ncbi:hypothetical protein HSB1_11350 [Halogranum salarium B-1]|uniref:Uncharacterized protein n=1 Tax=Halogranum salarium B-1 TaxID=1210908 RepID=J3EYP4_9EURY|nr:hypothetical protein HSB1_11350 [Halogranum salarium B-1]
MPASPRKCLSEDLPCGVDSIAGFPADGPVEVRRHVCRRFPCSDEKPSEKGGYSQMDERSILREACDAVA